MTKDISIPRETLEAAARAMAKAGYGFAGIELTDPYTADAEYWDHTARAACLAMLKAWPGMEHDPGALVAETYRDPGKIILPLSQEGA